MELTKNGLVFWTVKLYKDLETALHALLYICEAVYNEICLRHLYIKR